MVFFKDFTSSSNQYLGIVDNENDKVHKGSVFLVRTPLAGPFSATWSKLKNVPHLEEWSMAYPTSSQDETTSYCLASPLHMKSSSTISFHTLGRRIISGEVRWGCKLKFGGEFGYIPKYWEWAEYVLGHYSDTLEMAQIYNAVYASLYTYDRNPDIIRAFCEAWCPLTNTLHTSAGELSISLWDLRMLGGLPIVGHFYEEIIPSSVELTGMTDDTKARYVPQSCEYLFSVFHLLRKKKKGSSQVSIDDWIQFWFRGALKYKFKKPRARKTKSTTRPKSTHNPDGNFDEPSQHNCPGRLAFIELGVSSTFHEDTYLAAFLSCWLCVFVFPTVDVNIIRPGTFKVASFLANGQKYSLAVPVLASIYRGLKGVTESPRPGGSDSYFPIHYVYGWLASYFSTHYSVDVSGPKMCQHSGEGGAKYFDAHEARELIHRGGQAQWCSMAANVKNTTLVDNGDLGSSRESYFVSLRSSYLAMRRDNTFIIEPYSPLRFSRQFGFRQDIPGDLKKDVRSATATQAIEFWRICLRKRTFSKVILPSLCDDFKLHTTTNFKSWWSSVHSNYLTDGIEKLIQSAKSNSSKTKEAGRHKSRDGSDSEEFEEIGNDSDDDTDIAEDEDEQLTSRDHRSTNLKRACHDRPTEIAGLGNSGDPQQHNSEPHLEPHPKRGKPLVFHTISRQQANLVTMFDDVPSASQVPHNVGELLGSCEIVLEENDENTMDADDFETSACSVVGPHDRDLENEKTEQSLNVSLPTAKTLTVVDAPRNSSKSQAVPLTSCSTFLPTRLSSSIITNAIQVLGSELLKELKAAQLHRVSRVHQAASAVYNSISNLGGDPTPLQRLVDAYVGNVGAYLALKEQLDKCAAADELNAKRVDATNKLESARSHSLCIKQDETNLVAALDSVNKKEITLEEELRHLRQEKVKIVEDLKAKSAAIGVATYEVEMAEKTLNDIASIPTVTPEDADLLRDLSKKVNSCQASLDPSSWMDGDF